MQTVASLAERLDMTAEEAVEALRYMLFDVEGVNAAISDEQCDLLIDVDSDPSAKDRYREARSKEQEKAKKRTERLKAAAKKAAETRKATPKKSAAKKKEGEEPEAPEAEHAEILREEVPPAPAEPVVVAPQAGAEILPPQAAVEPSAEPQTPIPAEEGEKKPPKKKDKEKKEKKVEPEAPSIIIGRAIEHEEPKVQVLRADGTELEAPEVVFEEEAIVPLVPEEPEETGLLAEAERQQEEEDRRQQKLASRPAVKPDPAVVAEVKRKAAERMQKMRAQRQTAAEGPSRKTGKTARKKQKRIEKVRAEEQMRRAAAATVREVQAGGLSAGPQRRRKRRRTREEEGEMDFVEEAQGPRVLEIEEGITVEELADIMDVPVNDLILALMDLNILATKNQALPLDLVRKLAEPQGFEVRTVIPEEMAALEEESDDPADLETRAPVITVMGHVDHGKTTLLDRVRAANVAANEAGGITQHIAAYDVPIGDGRVVFLDTPGHEAFTQMRARGAKVTDVVVLVVAADDGVMPQTVEAIDHAKAAEVPIVVAINKCDKPDAQPDRIRQELTKYGLVDEQWGGKTIIRSISAKHGEGVSELMELLVLESQLLELKANPKKRARGAVVESEISRGQGPVAWVLVQTGTLRVGDPFLAGQHAGRVRSMLNSRGEPVTEAGPSTPVLVMGFDGLPDAGDPFVVVRDERVARSVAAQRLEIARKKDRIAVPHVTLEDFHERLLAGEKHHLHIVLKADVQGSVDVLQSSLAKIGNEEVHAEVVHAGVGGINESDVLLASASDAVIIGFHVTATPRVHKLAEQEAVDIRTYRVIYELVDDVRRALEGLLTPDSKEVIAGHAEVRQVFRSSALGNIAGCYVQDGEVQRGASARLVRNGVIVYDGKVLSLRREKDDARSVTSGFECGIKLENYEDIKVGDIIESYRVESVAKSLN